MQTAQIIDRIKDLPDLAQQELVDFLSFLEWKYAEEIQAMSHEDIQFGLGGKFIDDYIGAFEKIKTRPESLRLKSGSV